MALLLIISTATIAFAILSAKPPSITLSEISQTGTKGLAFIENALPIDTSQYNITLQKPLFISSTNSTETSEETYSLESEKSTLGDLPFWQQRP